MFDNLLCRKRSGWRLDHGSQFRWRRYPQPETQLRELILHHRNIIRQPPGISSSG
jgi:hypothetical protein